MYAAKKVKANQSSRGRSQRLMSRDIALRALSQITTTVRRARELFALAQWRRSGGVISSVNGGGRFVQLDIYSYIQICIVAWRLYLPVSQ